MYRNQTNGPSAARDLVVAYMAIGAVGVHQHLSEEHADELGCTFGGQDGTIAEIIKHADAVLAVRDKLDGEIGVWAYEVPEVVGERLITEMLAEGGLDEDRVKVVVAGVVREALDRWSSRPPTSTRRRSSEDTN